MPPRRRPGRYARFAQQAALEATLRYGPEIRGIQELIAREQGSYRDEVQQARTVARGMVGAIDRARRETGANYGLLGQGLANTQRLFDRDTANLAPVADTLRQALQGEQALAERRTARTRTREFNELASRRVDAATMPAYVRQIAQERFRGETNKLTRQLQGVLGEQGAFSAAQVRSLAQEAAERSLTNRINLRNVRSQEKIARQSVESQNQRAEAERAQQDEQFAVETGLRQQEIEIKRTNARNRGGGPGGRGWQPSGAHDRLANEVERATRLARALRTPDPRTGRQLDWGTIGQVLENGRPEKKAKEGGLTVTKRAAIKPVSSLAARAALDVVFNGGVGDETIRRLHRRRYRVRDLGLQRSRADQINRRYGQSTARSPLAR